MNILAQRSLSCLSPCVSCGHFFIRDRTILGHLSKIPHTVVFEASMPQVLRIPTMLVVLFDAVRKIVLFHVSCDIPSSDTFDIYDRTLAVVLQNSFSQAEVNRNISIGLNVFLRSMGEDDAFTNYVVTTFNTLTVEGEQQIAVSSRTFKTAAEFLNATSSESIQYKHSQSFTQPSLDALLQTINVVKYNKSSIFLFTDATPNVDNNDISSIVLAAVERQLEINIVITAPYLINDLCIKTANSSIYAQLAFQTGGNIINLCRPHQNRPRDPIVEKTFSYLIEAIINFKNSESKHYFTNIIRYTIEVMQGSDSENGSCNVRVVEKSLLTVFVGFSPDPAIDKYSATMTYGSPASPVIHIGSQLQSDPRVTLQITNNEGITLYSSTDKKRKPTCHYEGYFTTPFVCANPYDIYFITTTLRSKELVVQRSKRAYCYIAPGQCLHGGVYIRDKCQCTSQYEGQSCENPICLNKGSMKNFSCECGPSFTGTNCEFGTCYDWNYIETNDVRQHEFRQITFVVETTNIMILPMVFLKHLITNFVASAEDNNIPKQFSLITFDEKSVWKVISTSHPEEFIATFSKVMTLPTMNSNNSALSVQAINEAYKITIQPPSIIYVFTASSAITRNRLYLKQRLGTQVNIMYISPGVVPVQPTSYQLPMIARQSGGRILPITSYNMDNIEPVLTSMLKENALIYDDAAKDCTQGWSTSFLVESEITSLVLIITGSSVSQSGAVTIMDGEGQTVTPSKTLLYDIASLIIEIGTSLLPVHNYNVNRNSYLTKATAVRGNWTVTIKTSGSCFLQRDKGLHLFQSYVN
uniref:EGF-like domain-containing protein n=1 Tax=Heterorhabditis bacteriophora TaxID=37862 RepID=A0A1I7WSS3_HETBA